MMSTLTAILIFALLFMGFSMVRMRRSCGSDCGTCEESCQLLESNNDES
jgi:bacterioferritin-associated ferredoxin